MTIRQVRDHATLSVSPAREQILVTLGVAAAILGLRAWGLLPPDATLPLTAPLISTSTGSE